MLENRCFWWRDIISVAMATLPILRVSDFSMRNWSILPKWGKLKLHNFTELGRFPPPSLSYYRYIHIISSWSTRKTLSQDTGAVSASSSGSIDFPLGTHKRNMKHVSPLKQINVSSQDDGRRYNSRAIKYLSFFEHTEPFPMMFATGQLYPTVLVLLHERSITLAFYRRVGCSCGKLGNLASTEAATCVTHLHRPEHIRVLSWPSPVHRGCVYVLALCKHACDWNLPLVNVTQPCGKDTFPVLYSRGQHEILEGPGDVFENRDAAEPDEDKAPLKRVFSGIINLCFW